jgi:hypothetical protein
MEGSDSEQLDYQPHEKDVENPLQLSFAQISERLKDDDNFYKSFMLELTEGLKPREEEERIISLLDIDYPDLPKR